MAGFLERTNHDIVGRKLPYKPLLGPNLSYVEVEGGYQVVRASTTTGSIPSTPDVNGDPNRDAAIFRGYDRNQAAFEQALRPMITAPRRITRTGT